MTASRPRRWLRFSLRALLVAITLFCCWLGWEMSTVRQRQRVRARAEGKFRFASRREVIAAEISDDAPGVARIPMIRKWMGDEPIQHIYYQGPSGEEREAYDRQMEEIRRAFPEAELINLGV